MRGAAEVKQEQRESKRVREQGDAAELVRKMSRLYVKLTPSSYLPLAGHKHG